MWLPHVLMGRWARIAMFRGPEALQVESAPEKVVILGVSMVMVAGLTAIVWHSLLIDRRDVIVIGSFPVRHRTVLGGKLGALIGFFAIITVAMDTLASFFFGMYMGMHGGPLAGLWQMVAHFVASAAAGLFMYLAVISAQGLLLGVAGPRQFARLAPVLQLVLIAAALLLVALLPLTATAASGPIYGLPAREMPGVLWMPPVWFLGLYESILGTANPVLHQLAGRALLALGAVAALTATQLSAGVSPRRARGPGRRRRHGPARTGPAAGRGRTRADGPAAHRAGRPAVRLLHHRPHDAASPRHRDCARHRHGVRRARRLGQPRHHGGRARRPGCCRCRRC